ncbi:MAG: hypothetical protein NTY22_04375 [Proteobacteria bacterium]|nr:hypothetical protein [Pseudomonadota bacterium]
MNIGVLGFGKMGKGIASLAGKGQIIKFIVDPVETNGFKQTPIFKNIKEVPKKLMDSVDVFMEFTEPGQAKKNILSIIQAGKNVKIISGTTGWNIKEIENDIKSNKAVVLYSSNFSFGINALSSALDHLARSMSKSKNFEASILEHHHKHKKDAPSGTANMLAGILDKNGFNCSITSVRTGLHPGMHTIYFDSEYETIEITHEVKDRKVLCAGVLMAAEWITKQKKPGIYNFSDII